MLMNDMCKSKEEYQLLAGKVAPVYGNEDPAAYQKRNAEINVMAETVAERAREWVNQNRTKDSETAFDDTDDLFFGIVIARIDNIRPANKVWDKWINKSRPTAEALVAAAAVVEGGAE